MLTSQLPADTEWLSNWDANFTLIVLLSVKNICDNVSLGASRKPTAPLDESTVYSCTRSSQCAVPAEV
jgi:hypothetical protein